MDDQGLFPEKLLLGVVPRLTNDTGDPSCRRLLVNKGPLNFVIFLIASYDRGDEGLFLDSSIFIILSDKN